ncbi:MAG: glycosyltransferase [Planctomycetota bacterium]
MRVLLMLDAGFVRHEQPLLERLAFGLADEGVATQVACPRGPGTELSISLLRDPLRYQHRALPFARRIEARRLLALLADEARGDRPVDIIHAFGGSCWRLAADLAGEAHAGLALEVWRPGLAHRVRTLPRDASIPVLCTSPDPSVERELLRDRGHPPVRLVPWGARVRTDSPVPFSPGRAPAIMLVGGGRDTSTFRAAFEGVAGALAHAPSAACFVDASGARRAGIWSLAEGRGLLDRVTIVDRLETRRDLVLRADVLVIPDARGEQRSIILDAMGAARAVVAAADAGNAALIDGRTALTLRDLDAPAWAAALTGLLDDPERARDLGRSASAWIAEHRRLTQSIATLIDAYESLVQVQAGS